MVQNHLYLLNETKFSIFFMQKHQTVFEKDLQRQDLETQNICVENGVAYVTTNGGLVVLKQVQLEQ